MLALKELMVETNTFFSEFTTTIFFFINVVKFQSLLHKWTFCKPNKKAWISSPPYSKKHDVHFSCENKTLRKDGHMMIGLVLIIDISSLKLPFFFQSMLKLKSICRVTFMVPIHAVHANLWQRGWGWVTWGTELYISSDQKGKAIFISSFTNYNCDFQAFKL